MSDYYGDIRLGDTVDLKFTTRQSTGVPTTLAGTPVVSLYPGNSTTETTTGVTLTVDFDSRTGYNNLRVVASNGNGYATATNYDCSITTGTVNSVSVVGESVGAFSIENRSALMPATAARTLVVDAAGLADANAVKLGPSGAGTAQTAKDVGGAVPAAAAGAAGGILISGSNSGTTTFGALTVTGATTMTGAVSATNAGNDIRGVLLSGTQTFNNTGTWTGSLTGSVGSVTGAVGSVTGAVGSVTGAVGSVAGNVGGNVVGSVGSVTGNVGGVSGVTFPATVGDATIANQSLIYARLGVPAGASMSADIAALPTAVANADALLGRNVAGGSNGGRTVKQALYVLRNKVDTVGGNVYQTDDTTIEWSFVATTAAGNPITVIDPT